MSNKMKGVLKGLRYISQIFEDGEQQEMQIGFPTDVKHVAHIGWDGPAAGNGPSWIQQFKEGDPGAPSNGDQQNGVPQDPRLAAQERRCSTGTDPILKSRSKRQSSDKGKTARRHSSVGSTNDSPNRTSASENKTKQSSGPEDSPSHDTSSSAKASRRRKTKTSSSKSKSTSTTPDSGYSDPGIASNELKSKDTCQRLVLSGTEKDQNAIDDKARRIPAM